MAVSPNVDFVSGAILTASQQNKFGRGIVGIAQMSANYTLSTTNTALTTVTFTAVANRYYRVTYFEPETQTSTVSASTTTLQIRTNATVGSGVELSSGVITTSAAVKVQGAITVSYVTDSLAAGSFTVNAAARTSSVTGAPLLVRTATSRAFLLVEDLGPSV